MFSPGVDSARQLAQGEAALAQVADVLVVIPIEDASAPPIAQIAHRQHVPVLAYDGMIKGALPTPTSNSTIRKSASFRRNTRSTTLPPEAASR